MDCIPTKARDVAAAKPINGPRSTRGGANSYEFGTFEQYAYHYSYRIARFGITSKKAG